MRCSSCRRSGWRRSDGSQYLSRSRSSARRRRWLAGSRAGVVGVAVGLGVVWVASCRVPRVEGVRWWRVAVVAAVALRCSSRRCWKRGSATVGDAVEHAHGDDARQPAQVAAVEPVFGVGLGRFRTVDRRRSCARSSWRGTRACTSARTRTTTTCSCSPSSGPPALVAFVWMLAACRSGRPGRIRQTRRIAGRQAGIVGGVLAFAISAARRPSAPHRSHARCVSFSRSDSPPGVDAPAASARDGTPRRDRAVAVVIARAPRRDRRGDVAVAHGRTATRDESRRRRHRRVRGKPGTRRRVLPRGGGREAIWFVPPRAKAAEVPVRADPASRAPCEVQVEVDGAPADAVTAPARPLADRAAAAVAAARTGDRGASRSSSPAGCRLMVGRFVVHH